MGQQPQANMINTPHGVVDGVGTPYLQELFKMPHGGAKIGGVSVKFNQQQLQNLLKLHGGASIGGVSVKFNQQQQLQDLFKIPHGKVNVGGVGASWLQNQALLETAMGVVPY